MHPGVNMQQSAQVPQTVAQYGMPQPVSQALPQPAPMQPNVPAAMQSLPMQATGPNIRTYTPEGGEMLQITIMGVLDVNAAQPTVHIQVPGKHDFTVETQAISGPALQPKTTVTYIQPGDGLVFTLKDGEIVLGQCEVQHSDYHPNGFDGDLPIANGTIPVKITPLGTSGQVQSLPPITVQQPRQAPKVSGPIAVGSSAPRLCSPEEFQHHASQPGAQPATVMTPEEMQQKHGLHGQHLIQTAASGMSQAQVYMAQ
jgi:hypothetical protein